MIHFLCSRILRHSGPCGNLIREYEKHRTSKICKRYFFLQYKHVLVYQELEEYV